MELNVRFLGKPEILVDGKPVNLEQKKHWALLLYVLYNGSSTRDELAELLWCDYPEESARRNLRNCLYKLKMLIGDEVLETKGHSLVRVSPDVQLHKDVDLFITENSETQLIALDSCVFLDHFYIRNCAEFDSWLSSIRNIYEKLAVRKFINELRRRSAHYADRQTEIYAQRILEVDAYNEEACRAMMQVYAARQDYNAALALYRKLKARVEKELDVQLEKETTDLYVRISSLKQTQKAPSLNSEGERCREVVEDLNQEYQNFLLQRPSRHCILNGGIGMGKSEAIEQFIEELGPKNVVSVVFQLFNREMPCYGVELLLEKLYAWLDEKREGFGNLSAMPVYYMRQLENIFRRLERLDRRCVIILQNIEAIDKNSVDIFITALFSAAPSHIWVIGEYCPNFERSSRFADKLFSLTTVRQIYFPPLDDAECSRLIYDALGGEHVSKDVVVEGLDYSGGNLLLLQEYIKNAQRGDERCVLSPRGASMVERLISSLSGEEHRQIEYLSILGSAEIDALATVSQMPSVEVVQVMSDLSARGWIRETEENHHLLLSARFGLVSALLRSRMPEFKRKELHRLAAEYFERKYRENPQDLYYLTQVKTHYSNTPNFRKSIYYKILHLEYVLDFYDEFFPTIVSEDLLYGKTMPMSREDVYRSFEEFNAFLTEYEDRLPVEQYHELRMKLDFLEGRARIRYGEREKGVVLIRRMTELAEKLGRDDVLMKGYVEFLCYSVRAENLPMMEKYIKLALKIKGFNEYEKEHGVLLRFQGYLAILRRRYDEAERYLKESVEVFERPKLIGTNYFNLAAAYDYLAICARGREDYDKALQYIHKAISICTEKEVQKNLDLFYEDCGYILLLKGDNAQAEQYFLQSIELYDRFDTYWLRSVAESGLAIIYAQEKRRALALEHFRQAEVFSQKERAREEIDMLKRARVILRKEGVL